MDFEKSLALRIDEFYEAFVSAFQEKAELERVLMGLGVLSGTVLSDNQKISDHVTDMIQWASAQSRLEDLLMSARAESGNLGIQRLTEEVLRLRDDLTPSARILDVHLHRLLFGALARPELDDLPSRLSEFLESSPALSFLTTDPRGLPNDAFSPQNVVNTAVDLLLPCFTEDEQPALSAFLMELMASVGKQHITESLGEVQQAIDHFVSGRVGTIARIVVVAMTKEEAKVVLSDSSYSPQNEALNEFRATLDTSELQALIDSYGDERDDWIPAISRAATANQTVSGFNASEVLSNGPDSHAKTVRQSIVAILNRANRRSYLTALRKKDLKLYQPKFESSRVFSPLQPIQSQVRKELWNHRPVIVVMDAISIFHQDLKALLLKSNLVTVPEGPGVVVLYPVPIPIIQANKKAELAIGAELDDVFERFSRHLDPRSEIGIIDQRRLERWMHTVLPSLIGISSYRRMVIEQEAGPNGPPQGMSSLIFGDRS